MGTLWLWEPEPLRALIFKGSDEDQVPIKMCCSPAGFGTGQENQHGILDHKLGVARSER